MRTSSRTRRTWSSTSLTFIYIRIVLGGWRRRLLRPLLFSINMGVFRLKLRNLQNPLSPINKLRSFLALDPLPLAVIRSPASPIPVEQTSSRIEIVDAVSVTIVILHKPFIFVPVRKVLNSEPTCPAIDPRSVKHIPIWVVFDASP